MGWTRQGLEGDRREHFPRLVHLNPREESYPSPRPSPLRKGRGGIAGSHFARGGSWSGGRGQALASLAQHPREAPGQLANKLRVTPHLLGCGNEQIYHATRVADTNVFSLDFVSRRAVVIVSQGHANRSSLKAELLIRGRLAGAAA